jgi:hypothetical protein
VAWPDSSTNAGSTLVLAKSGAAPARPVSGRRTAIHPVVRESLDPGISEDHAMDKKAKTPKKPKQTKTKDGAAKTK